jgi:DNA-binding transcriptional MerR regulator
MTIGEVLGLLSGEFPDITVSKIRFLESEGLIEPERSPSGYRRFVPADVERLQFILSAQRDHYLPLRVIKEHLDAAGRGETPPPLEARRRRAPRGLVATDSVYEDAGDVRLTRGQLLDTTGVDPEVLTELEEFGLVSRVAGQYDRHALTVTRAAAGLRAFGFEARHLRAVKAAADREVGLIEAAVAPTMRQRSPGAHARAQETAKEIASLSLTLHAALVSSGLRAALDL